MGGSSAGGFTFSTASPKELHQDIRDAELKAAEQQFRPKLAELLSGKLAVVNSRDVDGIAEKLDRIKEILGDEIEGSVNLKFGGSVAKHTYVDGLSDVDSLLIMHGADMNETPANLLDRLASALRDKNLPGVAEVSAGRVAVTIEYGSGEEVQLVPAVRDGNALRVPAWTSQSWSKINPDSFAKKLVQLNEECNGKLVPTIKLAKAINATLPKGQQLSGYHIESMAIQAFKGYDGPKVVEVMLPRLFSRMSSLVTGPIKDSTGQSVHVDEYLGKKNSDARKQLAHVLDRVSRRMENATASGSLTQWDNLFEV